MERETMDRILGAEQELIPSSGFVTAVMERVRDEAAAPAPIPFPWKRALPGMALAAGVLGWGGYEMARAAMETMGKISQATPAWTGTQMSAAMAAPLEAAGWTAAALAVSLLAWLLSRRLAGGRGLL